MKTTMTFTIDVEVAMELNKLARGKRSALINSYLRKYFEIPNIIKVNEAKDKAEEAKEMVAIFEAKAEELEQKESDEKKGKVIINL